MKNKFIKLDEKTKWSKETNIRSRSLYEYLTQNKGNKALEKKYRNLLNINTYTYEKIEKYIMLRLKINDINSNIKKEIKDIEIYLENIKDKNSYDNIYKFIFGNKIK